MNREELLRIWLRGKGHHISDIKTAMDWWKTEDAAGVQHTDDEVLRKAEDSHRHAVETSGNVTAPIKPVETKEVNTEYLSRKAEDAKDVVIMPPISTLWISIASFVGSATAITLYEVVKWLVSVMTR